MLSLVRSSTMTVGFVTTRIFKLLRLGLADFISIGRWRYIYTRPTQAGDFGIRHEIRQAYLFWQDEGRTLIEQAHRVSGLYLVLSLLLRFAEFSKILSYRRPKQSADSMTKMFFWVKIVSTSGPSGPSNRVSKTPTRPSPTKEIVTVLQTNPVPKSGLRNNEVV